jgi:hypothetical protein
MMCVFEAEDGLSNLLFVYNERNMTQERRE